jgi:predicted RNase H-like HicB family nuclease
MENTPQKGVYRWLVYRKGPEWIAAALEFNIVEVGDDPNVVLFEMQEAVKGYLESAQKFKGFRPQSIKPILNQKSEEEYELLWNRAQSYKEKRNLFPKNIFDFGTRNLAAV